MLQQYTFMAKKKTPPQQQAEGFVERPAEEMPNRGKNRIVLKTDGEGDVIWDEVEPEQKASVIAAMLADSDAQAAFGQTLAEEKSAGGWEDEDAAFIINMFGMVNTWAFTRLKIDKDIAAQCTAFTEEQHKVVDPRGAKLLNKWLPGDFLYKDEIMFAGALSQMVMAQLGAATEMMRQRHGPVVEGQSVPVNGNAPQEVIR
jgi:hypothetical protein